MRDKLVYLEDYQQTLYSIARDKSNFSTINGTITGKAFMEGLNFYLFIKHEINQLFVVKPTFHKYTKVDETYRKLIKFSIPDEERWDKLYHILS